MEGGVLREEKGDGAPAGPGPAEEPGARDAPAFRLVRVVSVSVELPEQFPTVVLEDAETRRARLAFRIGTSEGAALAHALRGTRAPRPLTVELLGDALDRFGIDVLAVRLTGRTGSTYLAEADLVGPAGRHVLACRPSDGLALALRRRVPAPVLADERLFAASGDVAPAGEVTGEPGAPPDPA